MRANRRRNVTLKSVEDVPAERSPHGNVITQVTLERNDHQVIFDVRWQDHDGREPFIYLAIDGEEKKYRLPGERSS